MQAKFVFWGNFSKKMSLDLYDLVFNGPEYLMIVKPIIVLMCVKLLSLLSLCLGHKILDRLYVFLSC